MQCGGLPHRPDRYPAFHLRQIEQGRGSENLTRSSRRYLQVLRQGDPDDPAVIREVL
jgi:hypothetical protein